MFGGAAFAVKILAQMPVRGVKDAHSVPWRKSISALYICQGWKITAVIKQIPRSSDGHFFHKSVTNLTHNGAALLY
jgi:hypothetical protein